MSVVRVNGFDPPVRVATDPAVLVRMLNDAVEYGTEFIDLPVVDDEQTEVGRFVIQPSKIRAILIEEDGRSVHMDRPKPAPDPHPQD